MALIDDLKTILQIKDATRDSILNLIISKTDTALKRKLRLDDDAQIPTELSDIEFEVCVRRYNRLSNEGMSQYSQEGVSITFNSNDFNDFQQDIDDWKEANGKTQSSLGTVSFINGFHGDPDAL